MKTNKYRVNPQELSVQVDWDLTWEYLAHHLLDVVIREMETTPFQEF